MEHFDALVIGGGPAGATAGLLLARAGWSVCLLERKPFPRRKVCGEFLSATNWPLLKMLGLANVFAERAGPPVQETAIFVGGTSVRAPLPQTGKSDEVWGRALAREHLDSLLLAQAQSQGVEVRQPSKCLELIREGDGFVCRIESSEPRQETQLRAGTVIAAHGSWDLGPLATQRQSAPARASDWMAFKAHFRQTGLPAGLMPLLSFPAGYGGMVHCDDGRASLSCCIRRERLDQLERTPGQAAGSAVLGHILASSPILRPVLDNAILDGPWLSAGPIQPGIRHCHRDGVFVVGNAAGEAHPVVAEGISMAMQSAWLLTRLLIEQQAQHPTASLHQQIGKAYSAAWRRAFAPRIRAASAVAQWACRPKLVLATLPFLRSAPSLLTWGASLCGKSKLVVESGSLGREKELCES